MIHVLASHIFFFPLLGLVGIGKKKIGFYYFFKAEYKNGEGGREWQKEIFMLVKQCQANSNNIWPTGEMRVWWKGEINGNVKTQNDKKHMIEVNQGELLGASHTPNPKCYVTVLQKQKTWLRILGRASFLLIWTFFGVFLSCWMSVELFAKKNNHSSFIYCTVGCEILFQHTRSK